MVAGTVGAIPAVAGLAGVAVLALAAAPGRPWQGPAAVAGSLFVAALFVRHVVRRIGGVTGDVLGAVVEVGASVAYLGLVLS
jgi:adenosylcobinamide-GDP ribazoletransferase